MQDQNTFVKFFIQVAILYSNRNIAASLHLHKYVNYHPQINSI